MRSSGNPTGFARTPGEPPPATSVPRDSVPTVSAKRRCSKPSCVRPAVATLTYVYADSTAVLGPLAAYAEPHCYDLCQPHSDRLTAPVGWEVIRLDPDPEALRPTRDDIEALADAVREAGRTSVPRPAMPTAEVGRRGHLRVLRGGDTE
jgi:hypothetical protein